MPDDAERPYRLLDLACGAGMVRFAVARRLLGRAIEYVGIDTNRSGLRSLRQMTPSARGPNGAIVEAPRGAPVDPAVEQRLRERFLHADLELNDADKLAGQLASLVGGERFDEIHVHLLHPGKHGAKAAGPRVLRSLSRYLRPGGRLYHLFQTSSPFFDFQPKRISSPAKGAPPPEQRHAQVLDDDESRFRKGACSGGLLLEKCGHLWTRVGTRNADGTWGKGQRAWMTRPSAGPGSSPAATIYSGLAEQYSLYSKYATNFVILRRRRRARWRRGEPR